ncbi:hypothetical protein Prum_070510 [Phytohabitans rumicis]|uniref:Uncharacterized protein n=1 Tax=Phytohabitans rumicis TaxID=1076125 RepID=A0A6V8LFL8_9ACTN|nr:hypothetical protein Prum_070510 [Phytohabitans rumicis]
MCGTGTSRPENVDSRDRPDGAKPAAVRRDRDARHPRNRGLPSWAADWNNLPRISPAYRQAATSWATAAIKAADAQTQRKPHLLQPRNNRGLPTSWRFVCTV